MFVLLHCLLFPFDAKSFLTHPLLDDHGDDLKEKPEPIVKEACGDIDEVEDSDDEMETEEMFVDPHETFEHKTREWGGPRRGGRLLEPTRFGDWERKGRCSDF